MTNNRLRAIVYQLPEQGGDLPKIPGGTAIAYTVENALKSPKTP